MTPGAFIAKWRAAELKERSAAQEHFIDLCRLLGEPRPAPRESTTASSAAEGAESEWPAADVVAGNPPFLGGKLLNAHLGEDYVSGERVLAAAAPGRLATKRAMVSVVARDWSRCGEWPQSSRTRVSQGPFVRPAIASTWHRVP